MVSNITYENLSDKLAEEVNEEVRNEVNLGDTISEKELDNIIWEKAMDICRGDEDHFDVIDMAKAKIDCWDAIVPYGA
jgi:hypothetical protein